MNKLVNKFCNLLMKSGNKTRAYALFSESFTLFLKDSSEQREKGQNLWESMGNITNSSNTWALTNLVKQEPSLSPSTLTSAKQLFIAKTSLLGLPYNSLHKNKKLTYNSPRDLQDEKHQHPKNKYKKDYIVKTFNDSKKKSENLLYAIIENVRPCLEVRKVRVARATHQVPAQINQSKGETLALRWIIEFANKRKQKDKISFVQALALELANAHRKQGGPRQRRNELHKLAESNRSSIRYRWW